MLLNSASARMITNNLFKELVRGWPTMLKIGDSFTPAMKESKNSLTGSSRNKIPSRIYTKKTDKSKIIRIPIIDDGE